MSARLALRKGRIRQSNAESGVRRRLQGSTEQAPGGRLATDHTRSKTRPPAGGASRPSPALACPSPRPTRPFDANRRPWSSILCKNARSARRDQFKLKTVLKLGLKPGRFRSGSAQPVRRYQTWSRTAASSPAYFPVPFLSLPPRRRPPSGRRSLRDASQFPPSCPGATECVCTASL